MGMACCLFVGGWVCFFLPICSSAHRPYSRVNLSHAEISDALAGAATYSKNFRFTYEMTRCGARRSLLARQQSFFSPAVRIPCACQS
jgi:hypothetical protein